MGLLLVIFKINYWGVVACCGVFMFGNAIGMEGTGIVFNAELMPASTNSYMNFLGWLFASICVGSNLVM